MLSVSPDVLKRVAMAVAKATDSHPTAPKEKHVRALIIESHTPESAGEAVDVTYNQFSGRLSSADPTICLKVLVSYHRLLHEGSPLFLSKRHCKLDFLSYFSDNWVGNEWNRGYGKLACQLAKFLTGKLQLHNRFAALPGDLTLEKLTKVQPIEALSPEKACQIITELQNQQGKLLELVDSILAIAKAHQLDELKTCPLIPAVVESYSMYILIARLLRHAAAETPDSLASSSPLDKLFTKFFVHFRSLKSFFWEAAQIRYVATTTTIPSLPEDPPEIEWPHKKKQQQVEQAPPKQPEPEPIQQQPPQQQQGWANFESVFAPAPPQSTNVLLSFDTPIQPVQQQQQQQQQSLNPFLFPVNAIQQQPVQTRPSNPFADLLPTAQSMGITFKPNQPPPPPVQQPIQQQQPQQPKVITQIVTRVDTTEINKLKARIVELEKQIRDLQQENAALRDIGRKSSENLTVLQRELAREKEQCANLQRALNEKNPVETALRDMEGMLAREKARVSELERNMASLRSSGQSSEERLMILSKQLLEEQVSKQEMLAERERLSKELTAATNAWREERWTRASEVAKQGASEIEAALAQLNNPSSLGNPDATVEDVTRDADNLNGVTMSHLSTMAQQDESVRATGATQGARAIPMAITTMLSDAKGVISNLKKDQQVLKNALVTAASKAAEASRMTITAAVATSNQHTNEELTKLQQATNESDKMLRNALSEISRALAAAIGRMQEDSANIDEKAEKELLAAAAQIEALAAQLREAKSKKQRDPGLAPGEIDVDEAIMEAALAISQATSMLVSAAAGAQHDRVANGRANATATRPYVANSIWSEGLVSAGKAVALATHELVGSANRAVQSKGKNDLSEEGLIAAAHGVASSTAQLVSATRSKSDSTSLPSQARVEDAAKAVSRATALLVEAAKAVAAASKQKQVSEDYSQLTANAFRVKEMEQQVLIHRLENELSSARTQLGQMHRSAYQQQQQ